MTHSRTMWFSFALMAMGILEQKYALVQGLVPAEYQGIVYIAIAIIVGGLRMVTATPLWEKVK